MKYFNFIFFIILFSCSTKQEKEEKIDIIKETNLKKIKTPQVENVNTEIIESFVDSINIGEKGKCKVELIKHRVYDHNYVTVKFYIKGRNTTNDSYIWMIQNNYAFETNALMSFEPNILDFNNDKYNDITFISGNAARGGNEVRRLFIYDNKKQELISIINSQDFPNIRYNKELDCVDAFLMHSGSSTVFARIKNDSLIEFASVHNDNYRTVYEIDKFGKEKQLRKEKIIDNDKIYIRYSNYKPLKEYKE